MNRAVSMLPLVLAVLALPAAASAQEADGEEPVMDHGSMDHGEMDHPTMDHGSMDHSTMDHGAMDHSTMDHGEMDHSTMNHGEMDHSTMDHGSMDHSTMNHGEMDHSTMDHGEMDHSTMNHGEMDHSTMDHGAMPMGGTVAPSTATGPANAADAIWGTDAMAASRTALVHETSGMPVLWLQADRLEYQAKDGPDGYLWDVQGYYGGDLDKFWIKSEGEGAFGEGVEDAEIQALYSRAIGPWFDLQAGVRQDLTGPSRTHAVIGVQGVAPFMFEVDAAAFLSNKGDLTAKVEAELDQRVTQRVILQPRAEVSLSAQDIPELSVGAGIDAIEAGLRLRYHFTREFAPYIGVEQHWKLGKSADYARADGEATSSTAFVAGLRLWY
ncbi:copper resistance protein B [Croceicoccus gelatinilyticus]|uniref:copper resistance protein B n=1 Tax=Croceicoccus gelatinilyticus TaxID=2835536 RepID=UPI001BCC3001|nr:copper resistance protein B [Croceicoccus gelatinilyticus]MBS7670943.1 copper resistance protein B [Croceicoccus gelatinilyticus]